MTDCAHLLLVVDLAKEAEVSLGQTSNVKKYLLDYEYAEEVSGQRKNRIRLTEPEKLLKDWARNYSYTRNELYGYYSPEDLREVEERLTGHCDNSGVDYAFTLTSVSQLIPLSFFAFPRSDGFGIYLERGCRLEYNYEELAYDKGKDEDVFIPASIPSANTLKSSVKVTRAQNTNVFEISATSGNPPLARDIAQAYGDEYILDRQLSSIKQISEARKEVWNRIQEVQSQIEDVAQRVKQYAKDDIPPELTAEAQQAVKLWANLYTMLNPYIQFPSRSIIL